MTKRVFLEAVVNGSELTDEMRAFARETIDKLDATNRSRSAKVAEKRAKEDAPLIAKVMEYLAAKGAGATASEIAKEVEVSTAKASALCAKLEREGELVSSKAKERAPKVYAIPSDAE